MANYAYLDDNNVVVSIIYGKDENTDGIDWEEYYSTPTNRAKRTSWNTHSGIHLNGGVPFRKNFGQIGYVFREDLNAPEGAFVPPQPFPSWTFNEDSCSWDCPVEEPQSELPHYWDETTLSWKEVN